MSGTTSTNCEVTITFNVGETKCVFTGPMESISMMKNAITEASHASGGSKPHASGKGKLHASGKGNPHASGKGKPHASGGWKTCATLEDTKTANRLHEHIRKQYDDNELPVVKLQPFYQKSGGEEDKENIKSFKSLAVFCGQFPDLFKWNVRVPGPKSSVTAI